MREYTLKPEVAGGWGRDTEADTTKHPPVINRLHYEFQGWLGDDIVESFRVFVVSRRLAEAIEQAGLTGASFNDVKVTKDAQFERFFPDVASSLPQWRWLRPTGQPHLSDFWLQSNARLVVSERALKVIRAFTIDHCEVEELTA